VGQAVPVSSSFYTAPALAAMPAGDKGIAIPFKNPCRAARGLSKSIIF